MPPIVYLIQSELFKGLVFFVCIVISADSNASKYIYPQIAPQVSADISVTQFTRCVDHVALIAHSVIDYHYLMGLYDDFVFDTNMRFLPVCLLPPMMISDNARDQQAHLPLLTTQIVKVQAQGNAYVSDAVMQLAHTDTYQVFIHELAHFAGFLDEYPMSAAAARFQCNIARNAPNVIHASQLGDNNDQPHPYADIFIAQLNLRKENADYEHIGCETQHNQIRRFLLHPNDFTFLRFYDVPVIPYLYQYLWQQQVLKRRTSKVMTGASS
ncbi:MAG: hypothetical protein ACSHWT_11075 [Glaciecola sp.]|jgi:hypothetical protein